jgi:L-ribulokinase
MSTIVAGVDFGTLSVRVSLFDSERGRLGFGTAEYPLHRKREDPDHATQSHQDQMEALVRAMAAALESAAIPGEKVAALAVDTTGSSVVLVGEGLVPLDEYYLWCDHRSWEEAARITSVAHEVGIQAIQWCGGVYSSEWGFSKVLHWLRHNSNKRSQLVAVLEHCDMAAAVLCGITDVDAIPRSVCAIGHKWLWNASLGGFPPEEFFVRVDPLLAGITSKLRGRIATSDAIAGRLCQHWALRLGLTAGIPIPVGAFDAHWDAIGAGLRLGDVVNVVGTATCIIAISEKDQLVPGICGVVPGSVHPKYTGLEAGLSATGDVFAAIARRAGVSVSQLSEEITQHRAGETGMLRLTWDNGDRTVLVNPELGGVTLGWKLTHAAHDELFAAIEGCGFHTRVILDRMEEHGVRIRRVINGGGIPRKSEVLNRVYANILNKPVLVPKSDVTSLGSAIFAFLAAGAFRTIEDAQDALCPEYRIFEPDPASVKVYQGLYPLYRKLYFGLGRRGSVAVAIGDVLPALRRVSQQVRSAS